MSIHMWALAHSTKMCLHTLVLCCQWNNNKKMIIHIFTTFCCTDSPSIAWQRWRLVRIVTSCTIAMQYEFFSEYITYIFPSLCHHKRNTTSSQLTLTLIHYFLPAVWNIWYTFIIFLVATWCCKTWTYHHCLTETIVCTFIC